MADRSLKLRELRRILSRYDVWEDPSRGKGSHAMFFRRLGDGVYSYPVPTHGPTVAQCYVRGARKKFKLTAADGISDTEFYGE
jgi:hypothetical protein